MIDRRINVRGIVYENGKILAQQLNQPENQNDGEWWCTPGGGLDEKEVLTTGLEREMLEETGIVAKIGKLLFIQQFIRDDGNEQLEFFFNIDNPTDYHEIDLSKTTHGEQEIKKVAFVDPKTTNVLPRILQTIDIASYISDNKPVKIFENLG